MQEIGDSFAWEMKQQGKGRGSEKEVEDDKRSIDDGTWNGRCLIGLIVDSRTLNQPSR